MKGDNMKETVMVTKCDNCQNIISGDKRDAVTLKPVYQRAKFNSESDEIVPKLSIVTGKKSVDLTSRDFCDKDCMLEYLSNMIDKTME